MKGNKKRMIAVIFMAALMVMSSAVPAFGASVTVNMRTLKGYENYHNVLNWGVLPDSTLTRFTVNGRTAFCIQSGRVIRDTDGNAFVPGTPNISMDVDYTVETVSGDDSQQSKIAYLGYYSKTSPTDKDYAFTQMMIWQTLPSSDQTANGKDNGGSFRSYFNDPAVKKEYEAWKAQIQKKVSSWDTYPDIHGRTISIKAGKTLELADSRGVLEDYGTFSYTQDKVSVSHTKGSNILKVTAAADCLEKEVKMSAGDLAGAGAQKYSQASQVNYVYKASRSQDMAVYGNVQPVPLELSFSVVLNGNLRIKKTSEDGHIENVKFRVTGNGMDETVTTGKDGQIEIPYLEPGTYTVTEADIHDRYEPAASQQVTVVSGQIAEVTFDNVLKKGSVTVIKSSEDGFAQGIGFRLYGISLAGVPVDMTVKTDENGKAVFEDIPVTGADSPYILEETDTGERYVVPPKEKVRVLWGQDTQVKVENRLKKFQIELIKTDGQTKQPLAGAVFGVYKDGRLLDEYTSDTDGRIETKQYVCGTGYTIREIKAPYGYILDRTIYQVEGTLPGQTTSELIQIEMRLTDEPQKGRIIIDKTGEVLSTIKKTGDDTYMPLFSQGGLAGAVFEVTAAEDVITADGTVRLRAGETACTMVTGEDGTACSDLLYPGKYHCKEIVAPDGCVSDGRIYEAVIRYAGQQTEVSETALEIQNDRQRARIEFKKEIEENEEFGIFASETYKKMRFGLFAAERIEAQDGTFIPEGGLIEITCPEEGEGGIFFGSFSSDLPHGRYYVKEISWGEQYKAGDKIYPVDFIYESPSEKVKTFVLNGGKPIKNDLIKGSIVIQKTDTDDLPLAGALFGLFMPDEKVLTAENAVMTGTSDEHGILSFMNVPYGRYVLSEISAPDGFEKTKDITVEINGDGQIREYHIVNSAIPETGDTNSLLIWSGILLASAVLTALCAISFADGHIKKKDAEFEE